MGDTKRLRARRTSLYKWAEKELGFTEQKAREILQASGEERFEESKIPHYRALLKYARGEIDRVAEKLAKLNEQAKALSKALECPIPGCNGTLRKRSRSEVGWLQTCTEGGDCHPIIWKVAEIAVLAGGSDGRNHLEMVEYMLSERSKRQHDKANQEKEPVVSR